MGGAARPDVPDRIEAVSPGRPGERLASEHGGARLWHRDRHSAVVGRVRNSYRFSLTVRLTATELHMVGAFVAVVVMNFSADRVPLLPVSTASIPVDGTMLR